MSLASKAEKQDSAWEPQARHRVVNLSSDLPGLARLTNPDLVNAWGIAKKKARGCDDSKRGQTIFFVAANGTGKVVPLNERGKQVLPSIVVPPPRNTPMAVSTPTGIVVNRFK